MPYIDKTIQVTVTVETKDGVCRVKAYPSGIVVTELIEPSQDFTNEMDGIERKNAKALALLAKEQAIIKARDDIMRPAVITYMKTNKLWDAENWGDR